MSICLLSSLVQTYFIAKQYRQMGRTTSSNNINYGPPHCLIQVACLIEALRKILLYYDNIYKWRGGNSETKSLTEEIRVRSFFMTSSYMKFQNPMPDGSKAQLL